ncbi:MAG: DUF5011 domain-containing protein [Candidatus Moranbacteria bacterium]|nr:DUF5011 domain-containing protein [Candidatus Moranbacteria bacterium]
MKKTKKLFSASKKRSKIEFLKRIYAILTLPIFLVQMTSFNLFLLAPQSVLAADEVTNSESVTSESTVIEKTVQPEKTVANEDRETVESKPEVDAQNEEEKTELKNENPAATTQAPSEPEKTTTPTGPAIDPEAAFVEKATEESEQEKETSEAEIKTWLVDGNKAQTNEIVTLDKTYAAPQNDQVSLTFTKLPENPGKLSIEEITLSDEQVANLNALSNKAYDITSDMENGTFAYDLILPKPKNKQAEIKFAEDESGLSDAETVSNKDVENKASSVRASLEHFTIFVVAETADSTAQIVNTSENSKLISSDNQRMESDGQWTTSNYSDERYIEFHFNPKLPLGASIDGDVKLNFEYQRDALALFDNNHKARLLIFDQASSTWKVLNDNLKINDPNEDKTFQIPIPKTYVDTRDEINSLKIRFQAVGKRLLGNLTGNGIKTRHDYVALDFSFTPDTTAPSTPELTSPIDGDLISDNSPFLDWKDSTDNVGGSGLAGYKLQARYGCDNPSDTSCKEYAHPDLITSSGLQFGIIDDGVYHWRIQAVDAVGNESAWSNYEKVTIDATAPAKPTGLKFRSQDGSKVFACGAMMPLQVVIPDWDDVSGDVTFSHFEYTSFHPNGSIGLNEQTLYVSELANSWMPPADGAYGYAVRSVDKAGNKSDWALSAKSLAGSCQVVYDSIAPTKPASISFKNPNLACGAVTNSKNITVDWADSTDNTGVVGYDYSIDYPLSPGPGRGQWNPQFSLSQYTGSLNEGVHHIKVRAKDAAGNVSDWTEECDITYDSIAPAAPSLISPIDGAVVRGIPSLTNSWSAVDGASKYVYESYHDQAMTNLRYRNDFPGTSKTAANVADATFWWRVKAVDAAGNSSEWSPLWEVTVDNTNPTIPGTLSYSLLDGTSLPCGSATNQYDIVAKWESSADANLDHYEYRSYNPTTGWIWNGGNIGNVLSRTGAFTVGQGNYGFAVRAVDKAGNASEWTSTEINNSCQIEYDSIAPILASKTTFEGWYNSDQISTFNYADKNEIKSGNTPTCLISTEGVGQTCSINPNVCDSVGNCNIAQEFSNGADIDKTNPQVDAGSDKQTNSQFLQDANVSDALSGVASYSWTQQSGPGTIIFGSPTAEDTTVSADVEGEYVIKLTATDKAGNSASAEFNLIWDTTKPVITILGKPITKIHKSKIAYKDKGATAFDSVDGDITSKIVTVDQVDIKHIGDYLVTYSVTDLAGNTATETRFVNIHKRQDNNDDNNGQGSFLGNLFQRLSGNRNNNPTNIDSDENQENNLNEENINEEQAGSVLGQENSNNLPDQNVLPVKAWKYGIWLLIVALLAGGYFFWRKRRSNPTV